MTVSFALTNVGNASTSNLIAFLLPSGNVVPLILSQNYGAIAPGQTVSRDFFFTNSGSCGGTINATFELQEGIGNSIGSVSWAFTLGVHRIVLSENFDGVTPPALPPGWMATNDAGPAAVGYF